MANNVNAELVNMFSLSDTKPHLRKVLISRDQLLDLFDKQFEEEKVLCVTGVGGVGVTTALAMYAQRHRDNCASYFNNGWSRHLLNTSTIVRSLLKQLSFYTNADLNPQENETTLSNCIVKLVKQTKNNNQFIYFVFDGFDCIPPEYLDSLKNILVPLFSIDNARFLFSGKAEDINYLLPDTTQAKQTNEMLKFQLNDVKDYLKKIDSDLGETVIETIYELSERGLARQLAILTEKFLMGGIERMEEYYRQGVKDFYEEDYYWIEEQNNDSLTLLLALLAYSEFPLSRKVIMYTLKLPEETTNELLEKCKLYVEEDHDLITLKSDDFRAYLRLKLTPYKTEIELRLIDLFEKSDDIEENFVYLPALYKHVKNKNALVRYLTSEKVQHYLEQEKSQAALNEQCEYGYNACSDFEKQVAAYFRFAINRSVSREIEKNELSDAEIEALIAIGDDEKAFALTQDVFLLEERLKCLLIIAQSGTHLNDTMKEEIDAQINVLSDAIDYAHIPDKSLELAKLMMPVKMEKALEIIEKVAKVTKDKQQIDRLYYAISLSYNNEGKNDDCNAAKADIVSTKIEDDELRRMTTAMKSIMKESTASQVVAKIKELPANSQLLFLRYWIPSHKELKDIGDAVEYAVKLVIETSTTTMPKVSFLRAYCIPLPNMSKAQINSVVELLDAVVQDIKFPTVEYVKLIILVISALVKSDAKRANDRLQTLYIEILDLKDKALQAHCKALLRRDYEQLGDTKDVAESIGTTPELMKEIFDDIVEVLDNSAYHLMVVEGPIKALVCIEPSFVRDVIAKINTKERRNRAYLLAAIEYVTQKDIKDFDWKYFIVLFNQITYDKTQCYKPLYHLVNQIVDVNDKNQTLLDNVKKNYCLFKNVEQADWMCYFFASLYVWLCKNYIDSEFQQMVKNDLEKAWKSISIPWLKVNTGYNIAKVLSKISMKNEAREYVAKTAGIRKNQLSSLSCIVAYSESLNLYVHSLGILIRAGICKEEDLDQFKTLLSYDDNEIESMILWSRIALEYHGIGNREKFERIMNDYVTKPLDSFSLDSKKMVLYNLSPAIYLLSPTLFYNRISEYDKYFSNACIENIARYIQTKYPYPEYTSMNENEANLQLDQKDYDNLLDLIEHSEDEFFIFDQTNIITQSIEQNVGRKLSREIQRVVLNKLESIVKQRLPMKDGIQHNGYLISCLAMINGKKTGGTLNASDMKSQIEAIPNLADQAFLYAHTARYLKKTAERAEFIDLAVQKTDGIEYTFDKFNRYTLCVQESFQAAPSKTKAITTKVMNSLKSESNGTYSDYQRMLDLVRDHDEELADMMLEMMDDDPARLEYRKRLKSRAQSSKRIEAAKNNLLEVSRLNDREQISFFERQMESLIKKKNVVREISATQSIIPSIYNNPISFSQNAVLYFMENLYQKHSLNGRHMELLREIHLAIWFNLKLVLALASGTRERLDRINRIMKERSDDNEAMIQVGKADKGVKKLIDWYTEHPFDNLQIIDPHFHAEDLFIVKALMDINNDLNCSILTNNNEADSLNDVFQNGWNRVSSELPGRIEIKSCCYEDQPEVTPWHDRWWLLNDSTSGSGEEFGIRMASPSTLGSRITEISEMDKTAISSAKSLFMKYFHYMPAKCEERKLKYEETKLH